MEAVELLADVYCDLYGLNIVSLRLTEVYGPGQRMPQYIAELIRTCLAGRPTGGRGARQRRSAH
jgi:UDP-glucose 4-epimerase